MKTGKKWTALFLTAAMLCSALVGTAAAANAEKPEAEAERLQVAVIADPQYCLDSSEKEPYSGILYDESAAIFNEAVELVKQQQPDVLVVIGDISANGLKTEFEAVEQKLREVKQTGTEVIVAPGPRDGFGDVRPFNPGGEQPATRPGGLQEFLKVFDDYGFNDAYALAGPEIQFCQGEAYVARPIEGLSFIVVPAFDTTATGHMYWGEEQVKAAKERGDVAIVVNPYPNLIQYYDENNFQSAYVKTYADAGMDYMLSSDSTNINDIAKVNAGSGNTFYNIQTNSLAGYGFPVRFIDIAVCAAANGEPFEQLDITTKRIQSIPYNGKIISDLKAYAFEKMFPADVQKGVELWYGQSVAGGNLQTSLAELLAEFGIQVDSNGEITDASAAENSLSEMIEPMLSMLPTSKDQAVKISYSYSAYVRENPQGIQQVVVFDKQGREVTLTAKSISKWAVQIFGDIFTQMTDEQLQKKITDCMVKAFETAVPGKEDTTVYELICLLRANLAYGEEDTANPQWVQDLFNSNEQMAKLAEAMDSATASMQAEMMQWIYANVRTHGSTLLAAEEGNADSAALKQEIVDKFGSTLLEMMQNISKMESDLQDIPATGLENIGMFSTFPQALRALCFDTNYKQDNDTVFRVGNVPDVSGLTPPQPTDPEAPGAAHNPATGDAGFTGLCVLFIASAAAGALNLRRRR